MKLPIIGEWENPISSMARKIQKYEYVYGMEILDNGRAFNFDKFKQEGNWIYDKLKNKKYAYLDKTVDLNVTVPMPIGKYRIHLLDPPSAATVSLEKTFDKEVAPGVTAIIQPDVSVYKMRGMTNLIATVVDSNMLANNFRIKTDMGTLLLVAGVMFLMGAFIGMPFGSVI